MVDTARATKFPLPLARTALPMFTQASTTCLSSAGDSAAIEIFRGILLPKTGS
jgi:putative dehydrogenase